MLIKYDKNGFPDQIIDIYQRESLSDLLVLFLGQQIIFPWISSPVPKWAFKYKHVFLKLAL